MEKWKTTSSKTIVDDKWLKLRADSCITPAGGIVETYYVAELPTWANCVVFDPKNNLIMVRHYRHGIGDYLLEFIRGAIDKSDKSPMDGMKRELEEEVGYVGDEIYQTGVSYANPGFQNNKVYSFLAIGGDCMKEQQLEAGESLSIEKISLPELIQSVENPGTGANYQSLHVTSLFFAISFIKNSSLDSLQKLKAQLN
jgi:ADP-ribose pyrophosphatase